MKKFLIIVTTAFLSISAYAQSLDDDVLYRSTNDVVTLNALEHIGYGYYFLDSESYTPYEAGEFFFNILKLKLYPVERIGLEISADWKFAHFTSKENGFELDASKKVQVYDLTDKFGADIKNARGWMHVNSFNFPAILKVGSEEFKIGVGAEASLNYRGTTNYKYKDEGKRQHEKVKGMELKRWTYDFVGMVSFEGLTFFGKYYPEGYSVLADGSGVKMSYWTLGLGLDF